MKFVDHIHRDRMLPIKHFGNARTAPDIFSQIATRQSPTFHVIVNGVNRVWKKYVILLFFIDMDEHGQHLETLAVSRALFGVKKGSISFRADV
jgi:hypothetical protein